MSAASVRRVPRAFSDTLMVAPLSISKGPLSGTDLARVFQQLANDRAASLLALERIVEQTGKVLKVDGLATRVDDLRGKATTLAYIRGNYGRTHPVRMAAEAQNHALQSLRHVERVEAHDKKLGEHARMAVAHAMAARTEQWSHHIVNEFEEPTRKARDRERGLHESRGEHNKAARAKARTEHEKLQSQANKVWRDHPNLSTSRVAEIMVEKGVTTLKASRVRRVIKRPSEIIETT